MFLLLWTVTLLTLLVFTCHDLTPCEIGLFQPLFWLLLEEESFPMDNESWRVWDLPLLFYLFPVPWKMFVSTSSAPFVVSCFSKKCMKLREYLPKGVFTPVAKSHIYFWSWTVESRMLPTCIPLLSDFPFNAGHSAQQPTAFCIQLQSN